MPQPAAAARAPGPPAWALALAALLAVLAWAALSPPAANDLVVGDEGYYGVMARNLLASPAQWAMPSRSPLGPPGDKPPGEPALVALAIRALGPTATAVRLPSLAAAALVLFATGLLGRRLAGAWGAFLALALLGTLPWLADTACSAGAELPLVALGTLALVVFAGGRERTGRALAAGALFGLAFLCKLWLAGLLAAPALLLLPRGRALRTPAALAAGAALPLAPWLALAAASGPGALAHVGQVVFGYSLAARLAGAGFAAGWRHGPLFYAGLLGHAFVLALPLLAAGLARALAGLRRPAGRALLAGVAGAAALSCFRVQQGAYVAPLVPQLALLAVYGFDGLRRRARALAFTLAGLAVLGGAARTAQRLPERRFAPGVRAACAAIAPALAGTPPGRVAILAPAAPAFAFHTFRRAEYWSTPYLAWTPARFAALASDTGPRAFVVDTRGALYGGGPDAATRAWLAAHARELRPPGSARAGPLRVYLRR